MVAERRGDPSQKIEHMLVALTPRESFDDLCCLFEIVWIIHASTMPDMTLIGNNG